MMPIYDADTLRKVATAARLAEQARIQKDYVPQVLCKVNEANFSAANEGKNTSFITLNLPAMGLTTKDTQMYLRLGLETELEGLGLKVNIDVTIVGMIKILCQW